MSSKSGKPCSCSHHRSAPISRCAGKCNSDAREKKKKCHHCPCHGSPRPCSCSHGIDIEATTEHSQPMNLDMEGDSKLRSEKLLRSEKPKEVMESKISEKKLPDDRPEKMHEIAAAAVASQTSDIVDKNEILESEKSNEDKQNIEQMYKELMIQNAELEEKLAKMDCSMSCLREENKKEAACLKDALEKAKNETKLAARSRNLAMDLAKQSRDQTDLVKASKDEIANQMNTVLSNNMKLQSECNEMKCRLKKITDNEEKRSLEVDDRMNQIKCTAKQKESELTNEKSELVKTVGELTNQVKIQKKRICELTSICAKQQDLLRENENCISTRIAQLTEAEAKIQSVNCRCRQMQENIDDLCCRLNEETLARENLEKELNERQDNSNCELQIKDKIIVDQLETIKKLKKLLQDSEKMAHQAACEFELLRDELRCSKQTNKALKMKLDEIEDAQMSATCDEVENEFCDHCSIFEARIDDLEKQKEKAIMAAKFTAAKLCKTMADYERQLDCEKRRYDCVNGLVQRQEIEIQLLKKEILCVKEFRGRRSNDYIGHQ